MQDIISLYRNYNHYNHLTDEDLETYLQPSINLNQYKKHYKDNKLIGFTNWAFLSDSNLDKFKRTGIIELEDWNSGNNLVFVFLIALENVRNIFYWCINKAKQFINLNQNFTWLRIQNDKVKRIIIRQR
jgi:hemolysin-activating ACP:hemolysin acyltransferase